MSLWQQVEQDISAHGGAPFHIADRRSIGGGSINSAYRIGDGRRDYFVKTNRADLAWMFEAEAHALTLMHETRSIMVPEPIGHGVSGNDSYAVMNWIDMSGHPDAEQFGHALANLHRHTEQRFGFDIDNTIGDTPQINNWTDDWLDFWKQHRLGYQLELARRNGYGRRLYEQGMHLSECCDALFATYRPEASLLHGDLWSGNWAGDANGTPVIFDPASYYGDREADLAMMELFGHPGQRFFATYHDAYPIDVGYATRKRFYNLYHVLNHANMFGGGYVGQAQNMIEALMAELR